MMQDQPPLNVDTTDFNVYIQQQSSEAYQSADVVELFLPKFTVNFSMQLSDSLKTLGMQDAFDVGSANFEGMVDDGQKFYVSEGFHKTKVVVDESGTEAAAAISRPTLRNFRKAASG
eukprot:TRINITY_DN37475_c0_g1_i1.p1 TRINITY_DN37475_c0_g1~~TRINITY_DN37475_c0_g1_i1.p1  ORF type:complete len:117 (-),score=18.72 TRINITY_DN37475_c0_g1_i1:58-408(-)